MSRELTLGARPSPDGVRFRVWAPDKKAIDLVIMAGEPEPHVIPLAKQGDGVFEVFVPGLAAGARYRYQIDGEGPYPDPASRYQPEGVHGPSQVLDPARSPGPMAAGGAWPPTW